MSAPNPYETPDCATHARCLNALAIAIGKRQLEKIFSAAAVLETGHGAEIAVSCYKPSRSTGEKLSA